MAARVGGFWRILVVLYTVYAVVVVVLWAGEITNKYQCPTISSCLPEAFGYGAVQLVIGAAALFGAGLFVRWVYRGFRSAATR